MSYHQLTENERYQIYVLTKAGHNQNNIAVLLAKAAVTHMAEMNSKVKTITFDNGLEFADHVMIAEGLKANIYHAKPYASWARGINENTNGLIRQYFPKGTDFNHVSDAQVQWVINRLNNHPRKTRACKSPKELFIGQPVDLLAA